MPKKSSSNSLEENTGVTFWKVANMWQKSLSEQLEEIGLTHLQFILLSGLRHLELKQESVNQTQLSLFTNIDVMMTSQLIRLMEQKNYLKRKNDTTDSRAKKLYITKKGSDILSEAKKIINNFDAKYFSALGKESKKFASLLQSLSESLQP